MQQQRSSSHTLTALSEGFSLTIPDAVFARLGSTSADAVTHACSACSAIVLPRSVKQGYIPGECACEREKRYQTCNRAEEQVPPVQGKRVDRCYSWLGAVYQEQGLTEKTFANFQAAVSPEGIQAYAIAHAFAEHPQGIVILHSRSCGVGKSHLAAAICNQYRASGHGCLFTTGMNLFNALGAAVGHSEESGMSVHQILAQLFTTSLLVIDDIERARRTPFRDEIYFEVVNKRTLAAKPMVFTTRAITTSLFDLEPYLGPDVVSRLQIGLQLVELTGQDYRQYLRTTPSTQRERP